MSEEKESATPAEPVADIAKARGMTGATKWVVSVVLLLVIGSTIFYIVRNLDSPDFTGEVQSITQPQVRPKTAP